MSDTDERMNAFPPVSKAEWIAKVERDLRGAAFSSLRHTLPGGLVLDPLYSAQDSEDPGAIGMPGVYPYLRGASPLGGWVIRQEYDDPRPSVCKRMIRQDLERGVEALWLRVGPRHGCRVLTIDQLDDLLAPVDLAKTSIWLDGGSDGLAVASGLFAVAERRGVSYAALRGGLGIDPVGLLALQGCVQGGLHARFGELRDLGFWCSHHAPGLRAASVSSDPYDGGGASAVQELAYTVATGLEYLRQLTDGDLGIDDAAGQIGFAYAVSGDFLTQVAKLRAARWLWAKVVVAAGGSPAAAAMQIHCRTSRFTKTRRDPWVNMLRVTAESAAAILGGAQSIATLPFDCMVGPADELAQRIARNTQIVLREEAHLGKVTDPAGGSWYIERLTNDLARGAWKELRSIEAAGGIVAALGSGQLLDAIGEVADARERSIATRQTPVVGVSEFPNLEETPLEREEISAEEVKRLLKASLDSLDLGAHRDRLLALARTVNDVDRQPGALTDACLAATQHGTDIYSVATVLQHGQPDLHVEPVPQWTQAERWEQLRARSDEHETPPVAFLANLGAISSHHARATWARNLLAAAGIDCVTNDGFEDTRALIAAWKESQASLAMICGSDQDYEALLEPTVTALKNAGCPTVLVAGRPSGPEARAREAGVSDFVFIGADVLRVVSDVLDSLEVRE